MENTLIVKLCGKFNIETTPILEEKMKNYIDKVKNIVIDLEDIEYISSYGVRALVSIVKRNHNVIMLHPSSYVMSVFELTGMDEIFNIKKKERENLYNYGKKR